MVDMESVVQQAQEGHLDAFTTLFNHYQDHVFDLSRAILRDGPAAEDAVQDTFLVVFQKIDSYKGEAAFETWLTAVAVNACRGRLRRRKFRQTFSLENLAPGRLLRTGGKRKDLSDVIHERRQRQTLWEMVDQLDDRLRLPLILRYRYALSCSEIARILDLRTSTIYQQLNEGRRSLEQMALRLEAGEVPAGLNEMVG